MKKRRTVVLPDYPQILLAPANWQDSSVFGNLLDALFAHYHINKDSENSRWSGLAFCLMRDLLPAFQEKPKVGSPKQEHTQKEWQFPYAHEARLVQIVRALRELLAKKRLPSTNKAAYEELIRILRKNPAPRWRYGKLTKASAFSQQWKSIPGNVKHDPDSHFPPCLPQLPPLPQEPDFDAMGPMRGPKVWAASKYMAAYFHRSALERLSETLPSIPLELAGSRI